MLRAPRFGGCPATRSVLPAIRLLRMARDCSSWHDCPIARFCPQAHQLRVPSSKTLRKKNHSFRDAGISPDSDLASSTETNPSTRVDSKTPRKVSAKRSSAAVVGIYLSRLTGKAMENRILTPAPQNSIQWHLHKATLLKLIGSTGSKEPPLMPFFIRTNLTKK